MELMCSDTTNDNKTDCNKIKCSDKSATEITMEETGDISVIETTGDKKKQTSVRQDNASSGDVGEQQVHDGKNYVIDDASPTKAASGSRGSDDTPRGRKKWIEPTGRPLSAASGTTSPLLTSRAKRRSVPRKGLAQPKLVLLKPKLANATTADTKGGQPIADLDVGLTKDDTERPQSRSRSINRSPNEYSKRSHWK